MPARGLARLAIGLVFSGVVAGAAQEGRAQVVTDGTVGQATAVPAGRGDDGRLANFLIEQNLGTVQGTNLFHSFSRFDVPANQTATFTATIPLEHVIARVTGGSASRIDGSIRSLIQGADLYLLNPSGVVFGPRARIDVPGSFHVSTADELRFADGARFDARTPNPDLLLSSAPPAAFGFLGSDPATIAFDRTLADGLRVRAGETFSAIGGSIELIGANLSAPGAKVQLGAHRTAGEVPLDLSSTPAPVRPEAVPTGELGDVTLSRSARIDVGSAVGTGEAGGRIVIRAGRFAMQERSELRTDTDADRPGDAIDVRAHQIDLSSGAIVAAIARIDTDDGRGGDIVLAADLVSVRDAETIVRSSALGRGAGSSIELSASQVSVLDGAEVSSFGFGMGSVGRIRVRADDLVVGGGGQITTVATEMSSGSGGAIEIDADRVELFDSALLLTAADGSASGGGLAILGAERVRVTGGSQIATRTDRGASGGSIRIADVGEVSLEGRSGAIPSAILAFSREGASGPGGDVQIDARILRVSDGALIGTSNVLDGGPVGRIDIGLFGDAGQSIRAADLVSVVGSGSIVIASTAGDSDGGNVRIATDDLHVGGGGSVEVSTFGAGNSGNLAVFAGRVRVEGADADGNASGLRADSVGPGDGGSIDIRGTAGRAGLVSIDRGGVISARSRSTGSSGSISIRASEVRVIDTRPDCTFDTCSQIVASARFASLGGAGIGDVGIDAGERLIIEGGFIATTGVGRSGGNIRIQAIDQVLLSEVAGRPAAARGGIITSVTGGAGNGGSITIDPRSVIVDGSRILAQAEAGRGGNIEIVAEAFIQSGDSLIDASGTIDGVVEIRAPDTDLNAALTPLPGTLVDLSSLLRDRCNERRGAAGSLVVRGRDRPAAPPDAPLPSAYPDSEDGDTASTAWPVGPMLDLCGFAERATDAAR